MLETKKICWLTHSSRPNNVPVTPDVLSQPVRDFLIALDVLSGLIFTSIHARHGAFGERPPRGQVRCGVNCDVNRVRVVPGIDRRGDGGVVAGNVSRTTRQWSDEYDGNGVVGSGRDGSRGTAITKLYVRTERYLDKGVEG